jgi:hypothetical protein
MKVPLHCKKAGYASNGQTGRMSPAICPSLPEHLQRRARPDLGRLMALQSLTDWLSVRASSGGAKVPTNSNSNAPTAVPAREHLVTIVLHSHSHRPCEIAFFFFFFFFSISLTGLFTAGVDKFSSCVKQPERRLAQVTKTLIK